MRTILLYLLACAALIWLDIWLAFTYHARMVLL
jgi:hypothetical protein